MQSSSIVTKFYCSKNLPISEQHYMKEHCIFKWKLSFADLNSDFSLLPQYYFSAFGGFGCSYEVFSYRKSFKILWLYSGGKKISICLFIQIFYSNGNFFGSFIGPFKYNLLNYILFEVRYDAIFVLVDTGHGLIFCFSKSYLGWA